MEVSARSEDGVTIACLSGEYDAHNTAAFAAELVKLDASDRPLELDMGQVTFLDSAGISSLIELRERHPERSVTIVNPSPAVERVLGIVGLNDAFGLSSGT